MYMKPPGAEGPYLGGSVQCIRYQRPGRGKFSVRLATEVRKGNSLMSESDDAEICQQGGDH